MIELPYSFKEILIGIGVIMLVYYGYVILRYYRKELREFINGTRNNQSHEYEQEPEVIDPFERFHQPVDERSIEDENFQLSEELIIRIKDLIAEASDQQMDSDLFLNYLKSLLVEYPTIKDEILQAGITQMILSECELNGFISPSRSEVDGLWKIAMS